MNRIHAGVALVLGLAVSGVANAGGAFTGRVGATAGTYEVDAKATSTGCPTCFPAGTVFYTAQDSDSDFGLLAGTGVGVGRFFVDVGVEAVKFKEGYDTDGDGSDDDIYRSDFLLTLGVFLGDRWSLFGGFRHATFGDGIFSETGGQTEDGPFLGGGVSFRPGKAVALGASLAYNYLTLSYDGTTFEDTDLDGLSAKLQMSFLGTPHSVYLRWQRFEGEEDVSQFSYTFEYTEDFVNVGYQLTFDFASW